MSYIPDNTVVDGVGRYIPTQIDGDILNGDYTPEEMQAVQAGRDKLRAMGLLEKSPGNFVKPVWGQMTPTEQAAYDNATTVPAIFGQVGTTVSTAGSSIGAGLQNVAAGGAALWDGLNKTLIIVSVLVGVLTLRALVSRK